MTPAPVIRVATEADVKRLLPLFTAYRRFYRLKSEARDAERFLKHRLAHGEAIILIAEFGSQATPCGMALVYPSFSSLRLTPAWTLNDVFVPPRFRRRGVARALLREVERRARAAGATVVSLATQRTNAQARALYEAEGYEEDTGFAYYDLTVRKRPRRTVKSPAR